MFPVSPMGTNGEIAYLQLESLLQELLGELVGGVGWPEQVSEKAQVVCANHLGTCTQCKSDQRCTKGLSRVSIPACISPVGRDSLIRKTRQEAPA